jgi:hypothetical protein
VEATVAELARQHAARVVVDPWQGVLLAQRLRARGVHVVEYPFTGESRRKLFGAVLDLVRTCRLRCRPHEDFRRELLGLEVQETAAGWRVDHRVGQNDDHVVAVALAAHAIAARPSGVTVLRRVAGGLQYVPMTQDDLDACAWRAHWGL